jgi:hypothetical protein
MTVEDLQAELAACVKGNVWKWPDPRRKAVRAELIRRLYVLECDKTQT